MRVSVRRTSALTVGKPGRSVRRHQVGLTWLPLTHCGDSRKECEEASGGLTWVLLTH